MSRFPTLHPDDRLQRLHPPAPGAAVVIDTDAANEIDDPFAIAWALMASDRLRVQAILAAPHSFAHRRRPGVPEGPYFDPPGVGMRRSLDEIHLVLDLLGCDPSLATAGSTRYLQGAEGPEPSAATQRLIELASAMPGNDPLYVLAIGCLSNVANALLLQPELVQRLVVVWTAGWPSGTPHVNQAFNLEQDVAATRVVLDSGVPLVYLPGYQVGSQLRLSLPEMERWVQPCGALGAHLHALYTHNPLWPLLGFRGWPGYSWVIWDLINVAWMLQPEWVPTTLVPTPRLGDDLRWQPDATRPPMREAHNVQRDAIFGDFFACLARQASNSDTTRSTPSTDR